MIKSQRKEKKLVIKHFGLKAYETLFTNKKLFYCLYKLELFSFSNSFCTLLQK